MLKRVVQIVSAAATGAVLTVLGAGPASAAPYWQEVSVTPTWNCTPYYVHNGTTIPIQFKACVIKNASDDSQIAVVVKNSTGRAAQIQADLQDRRMSASCYQSTLNTGFTRGCLGTTRHIPTCSSNYGTVTLNVNGIGRSLSTPTAWATCPV